LFAERGTGMENRSLVQGEPVEVWFEDGSCDWGTFLEFFFGETDGYLVYERPRLVIGETVREEVRFVPIESIREIRRPEIYLCE